MKHCMDILVKCPYYKCEDRQKIFCEGVQPGTAIHLTFDSASRKKDYKMGFCKHGYNRCLLAGMQNRKWDYPG